MIDCELSSTIKMFGYKCNPLLHQYFDQRWVFRCTFPSLFFLNKSYDLNNWFLFVKLKMLYQGKVEKEKQTFNDKKTILFLQKMSNCEFEMNKNK